MSVEVCAASGGGEGGERNINPVWNLSWEIEFHENSTSSSPPQIFAKQVPALKFDQLIGRINSTN